MTRIALVLVVPAAVLLLALPAAGHPATARGPTKVAVTAGKPTEFAFELSKKKVPAGSVTFAVRNAGTIAHDFEICSSVALDAPAATSS
jgi:hypothetical protein